MRALFVGCWIVQLSLFIFLLILVFRSEQLTIDRTGMIYPKSIFLTDPFLFDGVGGGFRAL